MEVLNKVKKFFRDGLEVFWPKQRKLLRKKLQKKLLKRKKRKLARKNNAS